LVFQLGTFPVAGVSTQVTIAPPNFTGRLFTSNINTVKTLTTFGFDITATSTNIIDVTFLDGSVVGVASGSVAANAGTTGVNILYSSTINTTVTLAPANLEPIWLSGGEYLAGDNWVIHLYNKLT
jgi:hypothetical protein